MLVPDVMSRKKVLLGLIQVKFNDLTGNSSDAVAYNKL